MSGVGSTSELFMSTENQIEANRRNAKKSTGPKSEEGKARAGRNALRHGLTAEQTVLPHEDPKNYDHLRAGLIQAHAPQNAAEQTLVEELANAYWRLMRLHRVETQYWEHLGGSYSRGDEGVAEALIQTPDRQMRNFFRYYGQIEKSYYRALAAVNQIQRDQAQKPKAFQANGFVSQNSAEPPANPPQPPVGRAPGPALVLPDPPFDPIRIRLNGDRPS